jgi:hypothetical protein
VARDLRDANEEARVILEILRASIRHTRSLIADSAKLIEEHQREKRGG